MFDKFFEEVARKQLTATKADMRRLARQKRYHEKKGWITTHPNGVQSFDIVKARAHSLKRTALVYGIVYPGAALLGRALSEMNHR